MLSNISTNGLVVREVDTFYISGSVLKPDYDRTNGAWLQQQGDGWVPINEPYGIADGTFWDEPKSIRDMYKIVFEFDWYYPIDLSADAIVECNRVYTQHFGQPTTFYDVAMSANGVKLCFNAHAQKARRPESAGRGGAVNAITNIAETYFELLMEQDKETREECKAQTATLKGKEKIAYMKRMIESFKNDDRE